MSKLQKRLSAGRQHGLQALLGPARRLDLLFVAIFAAQELLGTLRSLNDDALAAWAAEAANRERLSLPFLGWLSDEELAASADEPDKQQRLWELGSKLMALREGLAPVAGEVLQEELRAAALRCSLGGGSSSGSGEQEEGQQGGGQATQQNAAAQQGQQEQQARTPAALVTPAFGSAVQAVAALGLSPEGLALFQQQAAALEAVVGTSRARSLTEVIGRAEVAGPRQVAQLAEADAAVSSAVSGVEWQAGTLAPWLEPWHIAVF